MESNRHLKDLFHLAKFKYLRWNETCLKNTCFCSLTVGRKGLNAEEEERTVLLKVTLQLGMLKLGKQHLLCLMLFTLRLFWEVEILWRDRTLSHRRVNPVITVRPTVSPIAAMVGMNRAEWSLCCCVPALPGIVSKAMK